MIQPYYQDEYVTLYKGNAAEIASKVIPLDVDLVLTDPPYPNNAGHFDKDVDTAREVLSALQAPRFMVFWYQLEVPPVTLPLIAHHIWHRSNTNRPDNYEAIYEFAGEPERSSRVFSYPVVYEGLTGCVEATGHPTQKNLKLIKKLISLRQSKSVFDPFAGSGTTLRAAKDLGVTAVGIERDEHWCEVTAERLAQGIMPIAAPPMEQPKLSL